MSGARVHWVGLIAIALAKSARMYMDIGHDAHTKAFAHGVHDVQEAAVELHDAVVEAVRIDVVVIDELADDACSVLDAAEKKGTALARRVRAASQLCDAFFPYAGVAQDLWPTALKPVSSPGY